MKLIAVFTVFAVATFAQGPIGEEFPAAARLAPGVLVSTIDPDTRHVRVTFHPEGRLENVFYVARVVTREGALKLRKVHSTVLSEPVELFDGKMPSLMWQDMVKFEFYVRRQYVDPAPLRVETTVDLDPWVKDIKPYVIADQRGTILVKLVSAEKPTVYVSGAGIIPRDNQYYKFADGMIQLNLGASPRFIAFCTSDGDCRTEQLPGVNATVDIGLMPK